MKKAAEYIKSSQTKKFQKLPLLFFFVAVLWILLTNGILMSIADSLPLFSTLQILTHVLFAAGTSILLYLLIRRMAKEANEGKAREEQLRFLIDNVPDFVCYKDAGGRWVEANAYAQQLFHLKVPYKGKTDEELAETVPFFRETLLSCEKYDRQALQSGHPVRVEEVIPQPAGRPLVFDTIKVPVTWSDGKQKGLVVIGRNITERKEAEEQYKSLIEQNPDAIASFDRDGRILSVNSASVWITGYSIAELENSHFADFVYKEDLEKLDMYFNQALQGGFPTFQAAIRHKEGHRVEVSIKFVPILVHGEIKGVYGIAKDITDLKKAEELLRKSDRLSVVGQLAAGVAHEIRNPLATLKGFVQLLQEKSTEHNHYYEIMQSELDRINFIVSEFMLLAKPQVMKFEDKDLHQIMDHVIALANVQAIINNVQITMEYEPGLPDIHCEENQLKQVFINIIKNSIEAMPKGGELKIRALKKGEDHIAIYFQDEGQGIPQDRIARLGEPFYSTKEKGMGLGLMVSYKIIEAHQGKISISSEPGKGTEVEIVLPVKQNQ